MITDLAMVAIVFILAAIAIAAYGRYRLEQDAGDLARRIRAFDQAHPEPRLQYALDMMLRELESGRTDPFIFALATSSPTDLHWATVMSRAFKASDRRFAAIIGGPELLKYANALSRMADRRPGDMTSSSPEDQEEDRRLCHHLAQMFLQAGTVAEGTARMAAPIVRHPATTGVIAGIGRIDMERPS